MGDKQHDTYSVLLKRNKLPMSLLDEKDTSESPSAKILETETYAHTFGPKAQRKKSNIAASSLEELAEITNKENEKFEEEQILKPTLGLMGEWTRTSTQPKQRSISSLKVNQNVSGMNCTRLSILPML